VNLITSLGVVSAVFVAAFTCHQVFHQDQGKGQTKREAMVEAWTNIVIGFSINYAANLLLLPMVGAELTAANNFWLGWTYTAVSIVRQYVIRRWFNTHSLAKSVARLLGAK
jgi:hypothetical protein